MSDQYKATGTERLTGVPLCPRCEQDVDEWHIYFEPNEEGYDKVHRCPHCNAVASRIPPVGWFFFFVGLSGAILWIPVLELKSDSDFLILALSAIAQGVAASLLATMVWKWMVYRRRKLHP